MSLYTASASVTRPANTSSYTTGQMIGTSQTAATCAPMSMIFPFPSLKIWRVSVARSTSTVSQFKVHMFGAPPTIASGDGTSINFTGMTATSYIGSVLVDLSTSIGNPNVGISTFTSVPLGINLQYSSSNTMYLILASNTSFAGVSGETFTVSVTGEPLAMQA